MQNTDFGSKIKIPKKHVKIHSTNHLELFCAKNRSKKLQIFQKWEHFENRPWCKEYSPCKILTLGQKLKFQKTCENPFYKLFRVVLWKKTAQKKIFKKWKHFENRPSWKAYSPWKILILSQKSKFQKRCQNPFYKSFRVVLCKKPLKKHQIFKKWGRFENGPSWKGYRTCKILILSQKLKFQKTCENPFYKSFRVVLCKKPLEKAPNIREMRGFRKSAIMQRPMQNTDFKSKIKIQKNMSKSILQIM